MLRNRNCRFVISFNRYLISISLLLYIFTYYKVAVHVCVALHLNWQGGVKDNDQEVQRFLITGDSWHAGKAEEVTST